jgi:hypothetical protein
MVALARLKRIFARSTNGDCEQHIGVGYGGGLALNERLVRAAWRAFLGVFWRRYLATVEALRLSRQAHDPADLVKSGLPLRAERRENVTQIDGVLGIAAEAGTGMKPGADTPWTIAR